MLILKQNPQHCVAMFVSEAGVGMVGVHHDDLKQRNREAVSENNETKSYSCKKGRTVWSQRLGEVANSVSSSIP